MRGTRQSTQQLAQQRGPSRLLRSQLQAFDPLRDAPMGAHMLTPRRGYTHHGIYVGRGRVVHYRGLSRGLRRGPVEEVSLSQFSRGNPIWISSLDTNDTNPQEVVRRARLRIGENRYRLLTNNCEHLCEWCIRGEPRSYQVDAVIAACRGMWRALLVLLSGSGAMKSSKAHAFEGGELRALFTASRSLGEQIAVDL